MNAILLKSIIPLITAILSILVYSKWPIAASVGLYISLMSSLVITSQRNLTSTRAIFYGVTVVMGAVYYLASGHWVLSLIPVLVGFTFVPNEIRFWNFRPSFKSINIAVYTGAFCCLPLAYWLWTAQHETFWLIAPLLILSLVIALGTFLGQSFQTSNRKSKWNLQIGDSVPDFTCHKRIGEAPFKLSDQKGRYVLLNFIRGDWCPICQVHMQIYRKESVRLKNHNVKLVVVGRQSGSAAEKFAQQVGLDYDILEDTGLEVASLFGAIDQKTKYKGEAIPLPVSFLISPDGKLMYSSKPDNLLTFLDPDKVIEMVRELLPSDRQ